MLILTLFLVTGEEKKISLVSKSGTFCLWV